MRSDKKAVSYVKEGMVFPLFRTSHLEVYAVEGKTGVWQVRYDTVKQTWSCNCPNVRTTWCSHIKAVLVKRENDGKAV